MKVKTIFFISIGTLVLAAAAAGTYLVTRTGTDNKQSNNNSSAEGPVEDTPKPLEAAPPANNTDLTREESFTYTDDIISPHAIANDPQKYLEKEITTRGWVIETTPQKYSVISINASENNGISLASENVDLTKYVDPPKDGSGISKPATLIGTLSYGGENNTLVFTVRSAQN